MPRDSRDCFWFGTEQEAGWFRTPLRGADASPVGWNDGGVLLNGGGYEFSSWGSHKNYQFEWGRSTPIDSAQRLKAFADGTYGRELIYFIDPLIYERNILPAQWADPGMTLDNEGASHIYGVDATPVALVGGAGSGLPRTGALYTLPEYSISAGFRGRQDALYVPIPEGYTLVLGGSFSQTGSGRLFWRSSDHGELAAPVAITPGAVGSLDPLASIPSASDRSGVWLFPGVLDDAVAGSVTLWGLTARLFETSRLPNTSLTNRGWEPGLGHSGTRFVGKPTYEITGPENGGQVGFAASFREVGDWLSG